MRDWLVVVFALVFIGATELGVAPIHAAELEAGLAVVEITPPLGYRMSGYFRERLNEGTKDPLFAKALVLKQGETQAALVFCDLIGLAPQVAANVRAEAAKRFGIPAENIALSATHSHTGPLYFGQLRNYYHHFAVDKYGEDPHEKVDYPKLLGEKILAAIGQAQQTLRPVTLAAGVGEETRLSFNRRFHMKDGSVRFNPGPLNPDIIRPAGPIDPDVGLLKIATAGEEPQPLGVLTVFALHLDTVGGTQYSADFPYYLERELKADLGSDVVSYFGAGTCGDINHVDVGTRTRRGTEEIGTLLAETVKKSLDELALIERPSLAVARRVVSVPLQQYSAEEIAAAQEVMPLIGSRNVPFLRQVEATKILDLQWREGPTLGLEVQAFRLGPKTVIVTLPGEVFVDLGLAIKEASPFEQTFVIELTNDTPAYIPTRRAFAEGSYETVNSRVVPGSGEKMVEAAIALLKELAASPAR